MVLDKLIYKAIEGEDFHPVETTFLAAAMFGIGLLLGTPTNTQTDAPNFRLQAADRFCTLHGYENGYYQPEMYAPNITAVQPVAGIHCYNSSGPVTNLTITDTTDFYVRSDYSVMQKVENDTLGVSP